MKLKDGLILREVAGQYVIVPTGKRVQEILGVVYLNRMGFFLWSHINNCEFEKEDLIFLLQSHYPKIDKKQLQSDIDAFVDALEKKRLLDNGEQSGWAYASFPSNYKNETSRE